MKILLNKCFGGFSLSDRACKMLNCQTYDYTDHTKRADIRLIGAVELLGAKKISGAFAELEIVDIPTDHEYIINEYDGYETVYHAKELWVNGERVQNNELL